MESLLNKPHLNRQMSCDGVFEDVNSTFYVDTRRIEPGNRYCYKGKTILPGGNYGPCSEVVCGGSGPAMTRH